MWDSSLGEPQEIADLLTVAWLKRKKYEARLQAVETIGALAEAMNSGKADRRTGGNDSVMRNLGLGF